MTVKYVAEIEQVREVTTVGTADLAYWRTRLASLGYAPREFDGAAQLVVSGTDGRFKGIRFRELSTAVRIEPVADCPAEYSYYFLQAFNSCRFFAWIERTVFSTPYWFGEVETKVDLPARVRLVDRGNELLSIEMNESPPPTTRTPVSSVMDGWSGPIFLPAKKRDATPTRRWFLAKISGVTESYPFDPAKDQMRIQASPQFPALGWLGESGFLPQTWLLRKSAAHAKSETYAAGAK